jgi:hypothetical protein
MSLKTRLRTIFMCAALELGVLSGVPMRPEEIRSLMKQINQPKLAHVLPTDDRSGDDPPTSSPPPTASGSQEEEKRTVPPGERAALREVSTGL